MAPIIIEHIDQIVSACTRHKLKQLYVFGSAARGKDFNASSDVDFLYCFKTEEIPFHEYADNFFDFQFTLEDMLNRKIDLVPEQKIRNPFLLKQINKDKIKLYDS